jgi:hypothetical protein
MRYIESTTPLCNNRVKSHWGKIFFLYHIVRLDGIFNGGYEIATLGGILDFRNYPVDYGVDEDPWPALGLHRRDD